MALAWVWPISFERPLWLLALLVIPLLTAGNPQQP